MLGHDYHFDTKLLNALHRGWSDSPRTELNTLGQLWEEARNMPYMNSSTENSEPLRSCLASILLVTNAPREPATVRDFKSHADQQARLNSPPHCSSQTRPYRDITVESNPHRQTAVHRPSSRPSSDADFPFTKGTALSAEQRVLRLLRAQVICVKSTVDLGGR